MTLRGSDTFRKSDTADPNCREECLRNHIDQGAADNKGPSLCLDNPVNEPSNEQQNIDSCISEGNSTLLVQHQLDSECSTTEVDVSMDPEPQI
ncbi:hypothetical protein FRX31_022515 [Thalictrum thalictroides]|uniref:Uncharacterized protein n=1 Tax=Thalictrum thalictroides TaxID=46969 RepID=A0A7J6VTJ0_THATH|nr:hypothetical protein FRX31_022515 [Thalictrum thalictroides]